MSGVRAYLGIDIHEFCLDGPGVDELESTFNMGLGALLERAMLSTCTTREITLVFLCGLKGAGLAEQDALKLTATYVVPSRFDWARQITQLILDEAWSSFQMAEDEVTPGVLGKPEPAETPAASPSSKTAASTSRPSGAGSPKKASRRKTSKRSPSPK